MPLRSKRSGLALQVLQNAHKNLESKLSGVHAQEFKATSLEDARKAVLDTESRMAARGCLRNTRRLMPLFEGLHHYSKAIEVLCNGVPFMPFVWAPIKFVINVTCENVKAFDKIIVQYSRIGEALIRFKTLQITFAEYPEFQQIVAVFYSDILEFNGEAYKFVTRSSWELFFLTSWGRFERRFESILDNLQAHENLLDKTADALNIAEARRHRELLQQDRAANMGKIAMEEKLEHASRYQDISAWLKVDDTEQALIFDSITQEVSRYPGTCDWVTQHNNLRAWLRGDSRSGFLWLQGSPGSGKTVLSNRIVAFLQTVPDSAVVRHFCDALTPVSINYDSVLRSLLFQLARTNEDLVAYIHSLKTTDFLEKTVTPRALEDIIRNISGAVLSNAAKNHTVHIVIDGLDVGDDEMQKRLVWLLERLVAPTTPSTCAYKVLVVSRRTDHLRKRMRNMPRISLSDEAKHVTSSIESYARQRFGTMRGNLHELGIGDAQVRALSEQLAAKADGMFLWARLVLDYISRNLFHHGHEIEDAISVLPRELSEFYEKILQQALSNFAKQSVQRLTSMFGWIAFAKRPLKKVELQSAITFASGNPKEEEVIPSFILGLCSQLVEERPDSTLALIHSSVKEYLQSSESLLKLSEQSALSEHATASITCLLSAATCFGSHQEADEMKQQQLVLRGLHAFQLYAQEYWMDYLLTIGSAGKVNGFGDMLHELMHSLSGRLEEMHQSEGFIVPNQPTETSLAIDPRLTCIEHLPGLHRAAMAMLKTRSLGPRATKDATLAFGPSTPLGQLLFRYQTIIRDLLSRQNITATSPNKLANFKETHKMFAFTCRIGGCRRLAAGFETEELRDQHEESHRSLLRCSIADCQYPPFTSAKALQRHDREVHAKARPRRSIRRTSTDATLVDSRSSSKRAGSDLKRRRPETIKLAAHGMEMDENPRNLPEDEVIYSDDPILNDFLNNINRDQVEPSPLDSVPQVAYQDSEMSQMSPPAINVEYAPTAYKEHFEPQKPPMDLDPLTPPERGRPRSQRLPPGTASDFSLFPDDPRAIPPALLEDSGYQSNTNLRQSEWDQEMHPSQEKAETGDAGSVRPYRCDVSGCTRKSGFRSINDLRRHQISFHPQEMHVFRCSLGICVGKANIWTRATIFRSHLKLVHKLITGPDSDLSQFVVDPKVADKLFLDPTCCQPITCIDCMCRGEFCFIDPSDDSDGSCLGCRSRDTKCTMASQPPAGRSGRHERSNSPGAVHGLQKDTSPLRMGTRRLPTKPIQRQLLPVMVQRQLMAEYNRSLEEYKRSVEEYNRSVEEIQKSGGDQTLLRPPPRPPSIPSHFEPVSMDSEAIQTAIEDPAASTALSGQWSTLESDPTTLPGMTSQHFSKADLGISHANSSSILETSPFTMNQEALPYGMLHNNVRSSDPWAPSESPSFQPATDGTLWQDIGSKDDFLQSFKQVIGSDILTDAELKYADDEYSAYATARNQTANNTW